MPPSIPAIESRLRFISKVVAVYLVYAAVCGAMAWYVLYHESAPFWRIGSASLIGIASVIFAGWTLRAHGRRFRERTRSFYSKLSAEFDRMPSDGSDAAITSNDAPASVAVKMGMYTVLETIELTAMAIYQVPANAAIFVIFSLLTAFAFVLSRGPLSIERFASAVEVAIGINVLWVASACIGTRRKFKKLSHTLSEAVVTISRRGLQLAQGGPIIPWTSLDRIRETRSWIIFMRDGRRLCALPLSRISGESMSLVREILSTARPQLRGSRRG